VVAKVPLPQRFQEAIDEAAMRLGETSSEAYLEGWLRGPWQPGDGEPTPLAHAVAAELEAQWPVEQVAAYLLALNPSST
jgi:hypothetical protein